MIKKYNNFIAIDANNNNGEDGDVCKTIIFVDKITSIEVYNNNVVCLSFGNYMKTIEFENKEDLDNFIEQLES